MRQLASQAHSWLTMQKQQRHVTKDTFCTGLAVSRDEECCGHIYQGEPGAAPANATRSAGAFPQIIQLSLFETLLLPWAQRLRTAPYITQTTAAYHALGISPYLLLVPFLLTSLSSVQS